MSNGGLCEKEIKRRIGMGKAAMVKLSKIWKDRGITLRTKIQLVKTMVFPAVLYGSETWVIRKGERNKMDSFELWCWRRLLRVPWTARKTNRSVLDTIQTEWTLESRVAKAALSYYGHVVRADGSMEKDIMQGRMSGRRKRGRPRKQWIDGLKELTTMPAGELMRTARERVEWRMMSRNIARVRNRIDGTR